MQLKMDTSCLQVLFGVWTNETCVVRYFTIVWTITCLIFHKYGPWNLYVCDISQYYGPWQDCCSKISCSDVLLFFFQFKEL
ncbi:BnaC03g14820D [Brassica napus]|uniref:BnaC03g14820D protein n=2 Tax=Brassica TaxID=3705 RepID=A0A078IQY3_BRANA|nr:BnaC03g14820D [Brassica napus]